MAKDSEQSGAGVTSGAAAGADDKDPAHEARGEEAVDKTTSAPDSKDQEANAAEGAPAKPARKSGAKAGSKTGPTEKKTHRRVKSKTAKSADSAIPKRKRGSTKKAASAPGDSAPAAAVSADSKAAGPRGAGSNTAGSGTTGPKSGGPRVVVAPHAAPVTKTDKDRKAPSGDAKAKAKGKSGDGKGLGAGAASTAAGAGAVASTDTLEIPRKTAKPAGPAGASGDGKGASGKEAGKESNRSKAPAAGGSDKGSADRESADRGLAGKDGGDGSSDAAAGATLTAVDPAAVSAVRGSRRRPWPIVVVLLLLVLAGVTVVVNPKILRHSAVHDRLASIRGLLGFEQAAAPVPKILGSQELSEMESLLSELGLEPGRVDGVIDGQTRSAISEFQEMGGLPVDGEPTGALLFELREVAGALNGG